MHHQHANVVLPGGAGVDWHHDYMQAPETDRDLLMLTVLYYRGCNLQTRLLV